MKRKFQPCKLKLNKSQILDPRLLDFVTALPAGDTEKTLLQTQSTKSSVLPAGSAVFLLLQQIAIPKTFLQLIPKALI